VVEVPTALGTLRELTTVEMEQVAGGFLDFTINFFITFNENFNIADSSNFAIGVSQTGLSAGNTNPLQLGIGRLLSRLA
jgi:hypothetical protein